MEKLYTVSGLDHDQQQYIYYVELCIVSTKKTTAVTEPTVTF